MRMFEPLSPGTGETARRRDVVVRTLDDDEVRRTGETVRTRAMVTVAGVVSAAELAMLPGDSVTFAFSVGFEPRVVAVMPLVVTVPATVSAAPPTASGVTSTPFAVIGVTPIRPAGALWVAGVSGDDCDELTVAGSERPRYFVRY